MASRKRIPPPDIIRFDWRDRQNEAALRDMFESSIAAREQAEASALGVEQTPAVGVVITPTATPPLSATEFAISREAGPDVHPPPVMRASEPRPTVVSAPTPMARARDTCSGVNPIPTVDESTEATVGFAIRPTIGVEAETTAVPTSEPTVAFTPESIAIWISEDGAKIYAGARVRRVAKATDAMSTHELRLYERLAAQAKHGRVHAGYGTLGRELGMDRQNVKRILTRLKEKSILDEIEAGRAEDRTPALYRVYGEDEILCRLRAATRDCYVRSGNGVVFVRPMPR